MSPTAVAPRRAAITIPNLLSLLRLGLTPLFLISVVNGRPGVALLIFAFAGITDALDGWIARAYRLQSRLGAYLDPAADKLLLTSAYVVLAIPGLHPGVNIPVWVTVMVIARDVIIVTIALILYLATNRTRFPPTRLSKLNTIVQVATAILVLASGVWKELEAVAEWAIWAVATTTFVSGIAYIFLVNRLAGERPAVSAGDGDARPTADGSGG
jgi:cardiolipin synthase